MYLYLLIALSIFIFVIYFLATDKEWYAPSTLFCIPFILAYIVAAFFQRTWDFKMGAGAFFVLLLGQIAYLLGDYIARKVRFTSKSGRVSLIHLANEENEIKTWKLAVVVGVITVFFLGYLYCVYTWGASKGYSLKEAINHAMLQGKFAGDDTLSIPSVLNVGLQLNYIAGYVFAYLIARRVLLKDKVNLILLILGYLISTSTWLLGGSRGPILENIAALCISFGIVYFFKTKRRMFSKKAIIPALIIVVAAVGIFFLSIPLMGRHATADNFQDMITEYFGSQIYNLNYFIENVNSQSGMFGADTLKALYHDFESFFNINTGYQNAMVGNFFVTANGHDMGNVFTTYYNFYVDAKFLGVFICTFLMGFITQCAYKSMRMKSLVSVSTILYLYMASSVLWSFFASRFFQNIVQLKTIIKLFWVYVLYWFLPNSKIYICDYIYYDDSFDGVYQLY